MPPDHAAPAPSWPARPPALDHPTDATGTLDRLLSDVRRRVLLRDVSRSAFVGAVVLLAVVIVSALSGASGPLTFVLAVVAAALALAGWLATRTAEWREPALVTLVESAQPAFRNLLVTARELAEHPERAAPAIRQRVVSDAAAIASDTSVDVIVPPRDTTRAALAAGAALLCAAAAWYGASWWHAGAAADRTAAAAARSAAATAEARARAEAPGIHGITAVITPPAYTGRPAVTLRNPTRIEGMAGSRLRMQVEAVGDGVRLSFNDQPRDVTRASDNRFGAEMPLTENGVLSVAAAHAGETASPTLVAVSVIPDQPPAVELTAPGRDLMFDDDGARVEMAARAQDDLALRSLELHYTKVSGSGERYEFHEGQLPLAVTRRSAREWQGTIARTIRQLELSAGDLLVYYAVATDARAAGGRAVSDSYVIEIGKAGAAIAGGFAIPPDEERFAISLNALIQKTEKLHAQRTAMPRAEFSDAALALAVEQRMVRTEFLFTMGFHGHVQDEMVEAEHSHEIQEGRLENRGQAEMAMATRLMTRAEQQLTAADTAEALKAQRGALAAMQRALSRHRYFLRTLPVAGEIDLTRRLTGDLSTAASARWPAIDREPDERAARIRQVLSDLSRLTEGLDRAADGDGVALGGLAAAVAARVLALDPASMPLQSASAGLTKASQDIRDGRARDARLLVRQATEAVLPLAHPAGTPPSTPSNGVASPAAEPALRGAVVDALRESRRLP